MTLVHYSRPELPPALLRGENAGAVSAVCVVSELRDDAGKVGVTAIDKRPVDGPWKVGKYGLYRDVQTDRANHGGLDRAVYALSQAEVEAWQVILGRAVPRGSFGENLRVDGPLDDLEIGAVVRIGGVELEATGPREDPVLPSLAGPGGTQWSKTSSSVGVVV